MTTALAKLSPEEFARIFPRASRSTLEANAHLTTTQKDIIHDVTGKEVVEKKRRSMNRTEAEYQRILQTKYPDAVIRYEAYTLTLAPALRYTPDFSVKHLDSTMDFHEVKGRFIFSRALNKPKMAAQMFGEHRFFLAQKIDGQWNVSLLTRNPDGR
jgi:hypothetical protein